MENIEQIEILPFGEVANIKRLSEYMTAEKKQGNLSAYSFLLADNRDMTPNDFAADIHEMMSCSGEALTDVTDAAVSGKRF